VATKLIFYFFKKNSKKIWGGLWAPLWSQGGGQNHPQTTIGGGCDHPQWVPWVAETTPIGGLGVVSATPLALGHPTFFVFFFFFFF
jgi:hypothetical protein